MSRRLRASPATECTVGERVHLRPLVRVLQGVSAIAAQAIGMIDVGFVRALLAEELECERSAVRLDVAGVRDLVAAACDARGTSHLRTYVYDGQYPADHKRALTQRKYLDAVAQIPGVRLRLGTVVDRIPDWHAELRRALERSGVDMAAFSQHFSFAPEPTQKGVDGLMIHDLLTGASARAWETVVVFAGDRDLEHALGVAQDAGQRVVLLSSRRRGSVSLRSLADEVIELSSEDVRALSRAPRASRATSGIGA